MSEKSGWMPQTTFGVFGVYSENYTRLPVFPGRSTRDMLRRIVKVTGIPSLGEVFLWVPDWGSPNVLPNVPRTHIPVQEVLELICQPQPTYKISADRPLAHKETKPIKPPALHRDPKRPIPIQIQEYQNLVVQLLN